MNEQNKIPLTEVQADINASLQNKNSLNDLTLNAETDIERKNLLQWSKNNFQSFHENRVLHIFA